jgi:hypothetical protein
MQTSCPAEATIASTATLLVVWGADGPDGNLDAFAGAPER